VQCAGLACYLFPSSSDTVPLFRGGALFGLIHMKNNWLALELNTLELVDTVFEMACLSKLSRSA
jgi:hypothetical protein